jgi:hypothetical protein
MTRILVSRLCGAIGIAIVTVSCAEGDPPLPPWADDVQVTGYKWDALPEKTEVEAGHWLDLTLSFKWTREAGMMGDRPVRPPAEWPVAAEVLTKEGDLAVLRPINSFAREFHDAASRIGTQRLQSDQSLVWLSPDPPRKMQRGRRYLWARVEMPKEPGTYRLVVNAYPTVRDAAESNPDFGPEEGLHTVVIHVKPARKPPPSVMSSVEVYHPVRRIMLDKERGRLEGELL